MANKWQDYIIFKIHLCVKEIPTGNDRQLPEVWKAAKFGILRPRVDLKIQMFPTWKHKAFAAINLCDFDCYIMFLNII